MFGDLGGLKRGGDRSGDEDTDKMPHSSKIALRLYAKVPWPRTCLTPTLRGALLDLRADIDLLDFDLLFWLWKGLGLRDRSLLFSRASFLWRETRRSE